MANTVVANRIVFTVEEVAERLRVDSRTVYRLIRRRELHARKIGQVWRVPVEAVEKYLKEGAETQYDDEPLSAEDLAAIRRGLEDVRAGRVTSRAAVNQKYSL